MRLRRKKNPHGDGSGEETEGKEKIQPTNEPARDADFSALDGENEDTTMKSAEEMGSGADEAATPNLESIQSEVTRTDNRETERLQREVEENKDKYLRALAEFENFKKRAQKDRSELLKYQGERIFVDLLDIKDNLELALAHAEADPAKLKDGVQLIDKLFSDMLRRWEVRGESAVGKDFDPNRHNAISRIKVDDAKPNTVINELKKAYFYKDRLIRPGEVVVAAESEKQDAAKGSNGEPSTDPDEPENVIN